MENVWGALRQIKVGKTRDFVDTTLIAHKHINPFLRPQNRPPMRHISDGHEFRPRGGLLPILGERKSIPTIHS